MKKDRSFTKEDRKQAHRAVRGRNLGCLLSSLSFVVFLFAVELPQGNREVTAYIMVAVIVGGLLGLSLFVRSALRAGDYKAKFGRSIFNEAPTLTPAVVEHEPHTLSPWTMQSTPTYYSDNHRYYQEGRRTCLVCGKVEVCKDHVWGEEDTVGSLQGDHTVYYRCRRCGATDSIDFNI